MTTPRKNLRERNFPSAQDDLRQQKPVSGYGGPESSYKLAFADDAFLLRDEMRGVRMQLELMKPELVQQELGIESTIVIFGSARIMEPAKAQALLDQAGDDPLKRKAAEQQVAMSRYYEEARRFAEIVSERSCAHETPIVVVTGGGPGIMEAGNRGAFEAGHKSIGLNIVLPHEQEPNAFITPELCFQFHYFAIRKMHFVMRSIALACFPGGFGTLDELFETLCLIQTGKSRKRPVLLFGREFWTRLLDFDLLVEAGMISPEDLDLFSFVETAEEAWEVLAKAYDFELNPPGCPTPS